MPVHLSNDSKFAELLHSLVTSPDETKTAPGAKSGVASNGTLGSVASSSDTSKPFQDDFPALRSPAGAFPSLRPGYGTPATAASLATGSKVTFMGGITITNKTKKKAPVAQPAKAEPQPEPVAVQPEPVAVPAERVPTRQELADQVVSYIKTHGITSLKSTGLVDWLSQALTDDNAIQVVKESALLVIRGLAARMGPGLEPWLAGWIAPTLDRVADKAVPVRTAALAALAAMQRAISPDATQLLLPSIYKAAAPLGKWQTKEAAFRLLLHLVEAAPEDCAAALPEMVPVVSDGMVDSRSEVKAAAQAAAEAVFALAGNKDIASCVPAFLSCIKAPKQVPDAIIKLAGTTFVQSVEAPALAVMTPLLVKGLREDAVVRRKCALIIANMSKLVTNPTDALLFLPKLLPRLEAAAAETPDPECRSVCVMAEATVKRVVAEGQSRAQEASFKRITESETYSALLEVLPTTAPGFPLPRTDAFVETPFRYAAFLAAKLTNARVLETNAWLARVMPCLAALMHGPHARTTVEVVATAWAARCEALSRVVVVEVDSDDDDSALLCACEFSLAYGAKILLDSARLRLKRAHRYGLCGHNGVGKTTLMRAINNGQVDGFPPKDVLTTVYLESDIDPNLAEVPVVDFVFRDPALVSNPKPPSQAEVHAMLEQVGFDDAKWSQPVGSLSGGWKMKLALARAMLMHPHILLLDEPTNHLDVTNVAWLENYLIKVTPHVTCMIVSHDSSFLDTMCTDIIHFEGRRLRYFRGNLSEFVKVKPEAKAYYTLQAATIRFTFPKPTFLDGITSAEKPILTARKITFAYPGAAQPVLEDVSCTTRLSSRIAILGPNGAGKSTLVKCLTGELKPDVGTVIKHPNVRMAYVSQHALNHLEDHLDRTPNQYIRRRYQKGEDLEEAEKVTRQLSPEEEEAIRNQVWLIDGQRRVLDRLVGRRKKKKGFEYEVSWKGLSSIEYNKWITREELVDKGYLKIVRELDDRINAEKGEAAARPLTHAAIEAYLQEFGLEAEFASHSAIRGLSGGQKVKLVLAAALWHCPHLIVLDEPTNYLDRDSLGALAQAIKEFEGGVIMISHHSEFVGALASEVWTIKDGRLSVSTKEPSDE